MSLFVQNDRDQIRRTEYTAVVKEMREGLVWDSANPIVRTGVPLEPLQFEPFSKTRRAHKSPCPPSRGSAEKRRNTTTKRRVDRLFV